MLAFNDISEKIVAAVTGHRTHLREAGFGGETLEEMCREYHRMIISVIEGKLDDKTDRQVTGDDSEEGSAGENYGL